MWFWLCWVLTCAGSSLDAEGALSSCSARASHCVASLVVERRLEGPWAQQLQLPGSWLQAQQLWRAGLVAPRHVGSSWFRDRTRVSCIGRRILYYWATREAHHGLSNLQCTPLPCQECPFHLACSHLLLRTRLRSSPTRSRTGPSLVWGGLHFSGVPGHSMFTWSTALFTVWRDWSFPGLLLLWLWISSGQRLYLVPVSCAWHSTWRFKTQSIWTYARNALCMLLYAFGLFFFPARSQQDKGWPLVPVCLLVLKPEVGTYFLSPLCFFHIIMTQYSLHCF